MAFRFLVVGFFGLAVGSFWFVWTGSWIGGWFILFIDVVMKRYGVFLLIYVQNALNFVYLTIEVRDRHVSGNSFCLMSVMTENGMNLRV